MTFATLKNIVSNIRNEYLMATMIKEHCTTGSWKVNADKFLAFLDDGVPRYSVFMVKGNIKLPFVSFSALPAVTCPGAGACLQWCYSYKAWRYPAAFFRQLQNTILVFQKSPYLTQAWNDIKLKKGQTETTVRLYVDGDFDSAETLDYWMQRCKDRPELTVYGYSKSWEIFINYQKDWPSNYILNVSSGSRYGDEIKAKVLALSCTRGEFIAVKIHEKKYNLTYVREALEVFGKKAMVCPGRCGACRGNGQHACGSWSLKGVPIIIGVH